jgi:sugar phosphate isomerase/epimerase
MRSISFISANFVGRALNYPGGHVGEWSKFDAATVAQSPQRDFPSIAAEVSAEGFRSIDLWTAHCHWQKHDPPCADHVRRICASNGLTVTSYVGGFQASAAPEVEALFRFMYRLGAPIFAGMNWGLPDDDRAGLIDEVASQFNVRWAHENHPEKTPDEILQRIAHGRYRSCGIALDTGWCATQGLDALEAVKAVREHLFIVHLKDIQAAGAHDTCALGEGIAPVERVVRFLVETNWQGTIGIEHEPFDRDPMPEVRTSLRRLKQWLS